MATDDTDTTDKDALADSEIIVCDDDAEIIPDGGVQLDYAPGVENLPETGLLAVLPDSRYCYLGVDGHGRHHHVDVRERVIYATDTEPERWRASGDVRIHWVIRGRLAHQQRLDESGDLQAQLNRWVKFVADDCGWQERHRGVAARLFDRINEVVR